MVNFKVPWPSQNREYATVLFD